jgi:hypothetical protein
MLKKLFEILKGVVTKCSLFWDIEPCSLLKICLFLLIVSLFLGLFFYREGGGDVFPETPVGF